MPCRIMTCSRSLLGMVAVVIGLLALIAPPTFAQDVQARVEFAAVRNETDIIVHVSLPRGQTIESANLNIDGGSLELLAEPTTLPADQWFVLDAGESSINIAPTIQAGVQRFMEGTPDDTRTGLILFAETTQLFQPSSNEREVDLWLGDYSARVNEPGCISTALDQLAAQERPFDRARRVLIIAGSLSRQTQCGDTGVVDVNAPVDIVIASDAEEDFYQEVAEASGGTLYRANIRNLDARVNEVKTLWSQPIYRLNGTRTTQDLSEATLSLTLANEDVVLFENLAFTAYTDDEPESTETPTGLLSLPGNTSVPTAIPNNNPTAVAVSPSETPMATATVITTIEASPTLIPTTAVAIVQVLDPTATVTPQPIATVAPPTPIPEETPEGFSLSRQNPYLLAILAVVAGVAAGLLLILRVTRQRYQTQIISSTSLTTQMDTRGTDIASKADPDNFYNLPVGEPDDITHMYDSKPSQPNEDEITAMVSESNLMAMIQPMIGRLIVENSDQTYDIPYPRASVGRKRDNVIQLKGDPQISRYHVTLQMHSDGQVWLIINTKNPIVRNGSRVRSSIPLKDGDILVLSETLRTRFEARPISPELIAKTPPPPADDGPHSPAPTSNDDEDDDQNTETLPDFDPDQGE
jgi:pSer/pThr/pTyr-binding forkhead associated (FHA) protein